MEARQRVKLTGTNRPSGLATTHPQTGHPPASTMRFPGYGREHHPKKRGSAGTYLHRVTVAIAKGKHPDPFRTRKLSPSAPMVLRGGPRGRVGRRRTTTIQGRSHHRSGPERCLHDVFAWDGTDVARIVSTLGVTRIGDSDVTRIGDTDVSIQGAVSAGHQVQRALIPNALRAPATRSRRPGVRSRSFRAGCRSCRNLPPRPARTRPWLLPAAGCHRAGEWPARPGLGWALASRPGRSTARSGSFLPSGTGARAAARAGPGLFSVTVRRCTALIGAPPGRAWR